VTRERRAGRTRRPRHSYSPEVADLIYERLAADGESLRQICQDTSMPARSTVFVWLRQRADFRQEYAFAKRFQIQWLADEMVE
jgi:transposase-like protein